MEEQDPVVFDSTNIPDETKASGHSPRTGGYQAKPAQPIFPPKGKAPRPPSGGTGQSCNPPPNFDWDYDDVDTSDPPQKNGS